MALSIENENGIFILTGAINSNTSKYFKNHFKSIMKIKNEVTINIDNVNYIDKAGLSVLRGFYTNCLTNCNKAFYIVGNGCKDIYDEFRYETTD